MQQQGRVVALDGKSVWLDVARQTTCGTCAAKQGCGTALVENALSSATNIIEVKDSGAGLSIGSTAVVFIPEDQLVQTSLFVYGLPLIMLLLGAVLGGMLGADIYALLGAVAGFGLSAMLVRFLDTRFGSRIAPVILRASQGDPISVIS